LRRSPLASRVTAFVRAGSARRGFRPRVLSGALILACSVVLLGGCYWPAKSDFSQEQFARDKYECQREAGVFGTDVRDCLEARGYSTSMIPWRAPVLAQRAAAVRATPPEPIKTPFEQLTEARRQPTRQLLGRIDAGECPRLQTCLLDYEVTVRRLGDWVGYTFTSADELLFRAVRQIGKAADEGTITQEQAVNRLLVLDASIEEQYRAIHGAQRPKP